MKDVRINFFESSTNKNVKYIYNTIENDKDLTNTLIIIPLEKYKMNEKYILNIRLNFENEDKKSKFVQGNVSFFTKSFKQNVTDDIISINGEQYIDIKNHWIEEHFENLSENNIIFEKRKSEFAPDEFATRDEVTKMIANAFELENDTSSLVKFKDVTIKNKYYNYIDTVSDYGLIKGDGENFRPENNITREEFITIMMRIHNNLALNDKKYVAIVKDIDDASDYAKNHIIKAKSLNIIKGKSDNKFYPKDNITRAEVAIIINRIIEYFKNANSTII